VAVYSQLDVISYCNEYSTKCPEQFLHEFGNSSVSFCVSNEIANVFEDGALADDEGNTRGCRMFQITGATPTAAQCSEASLQSRRCGDFCTTFCGANFFYCNETGHGQYGTFSECQDMCNIAYPQGSTLLTGTNTDTCRFYHTLVAGRPGLAAAHCPHTGLVTQSGVCGSPAEVYVDILPRACHGFNVNKLNTSKVIAGITADGSGFGKSVDTSGDSLICRIYHAGVALQQDEAGRELHCGHAAHDGGSVCGDSCEVYCRLMNNTVCKGTIDPAACINQCERFYNNASLNTITDGISLQCRTYHLGVAINGDPTHCAHSGWSGDGACGSLCENYCYQANHTCGAKLQSGYFSNQGCMDVCEIFPLGTGADTGVHTTNCRMYHIGVAVALQADTASFDAHCSHAGASGANVCGKFCDTYCNLMRSRCPTSFATDLECQRACSAMDKDVLTAQSGPSVNCRIYHAGAAVQTKDLSHCGHAEFMSLDNICGTEIENLCQSQILGCKAPFTQASCVNVAENFLPGFRNATSGNSNNCRLYHSLVGITQNQTAHCLHGGTDGGFKDGGVCGSICEAYCTLQEKVCPTNFNSTATCLTVCANFTKTGLIGATDGNSIQCRLYHVGVAADLTPAAGYLAHCNHSSTSGGGVCVGAVKTVTTPANTNATTAASGTNATGTGATSATGTDDTDNVAIMSVSLIAIALLSMII
jgi:hypothetical protein